jgi:hypothetical protein
MRRPYPYRVKRNSIPSMPPLLTLSVVHSPLPPKRLQRKSPMCVSLHHAFLLFLTLRASNILLFGLPGSSQPAVTGTPPRKKKEEKNTSESPSKSTPKITSFFSKTAG